MLLFRSFELIRRDMHLATGRSVWSWLSFPSLRVDVFHLHTTSLRELCTVAKLRVLLNTHGALTCTTTVTVTNLQMFFKLRTSSSTFLAVCTDTNLLGSSSGDQPKGETLFPILGRQTTVNVLRLNQSTGNTLIKAQAIFYLLKNQVASATLK